MPGLLNWGQTGVRAWSDPNRDAVLNNWSPTTRSVERIRSSTSSSESLASGTRSESRQIGIVGGTVAGIPADGRTRGSSSYHRVVWESRALIFEDESRDAGSWTERREVWSMDPDGRLHVGLTIRGSDRPARSLTLTYRRE